MRRRTLMLGIVMVLLLLLSLFAPPPISRTVQADQSSACRGLSTAFQVCLANNPNRSNCQRIFEQFLALGCASGLDSGSQ